MGPNDSLKSQRCSFGRRGGVERGKQSHFIPPIRLNTHGVLVVRTHEVCPIETDGGHDLEHVYTGGDVGT